jgi:hypothetical protein
MWLLLRVAGLENKLNFPKRTDLKTNACYLANAYYLRHLFMLLSANHITSSSRTTTVVISSITIITTR